MVGIELRHEIVAVVAIVIVEEGKVSFLAARAARPCGPVIVTPALARGNENAMLFAPALRFQGRILIGKPSIVRHVLGEHCLQRLRHHRERFGRSLCHHHGDAASSGQPQHSGRPAAAIEDEHEISGQQGDPGQDAGNGRKAEQADIVGRIEPPASEPDESRKPQGSTEEKFDAATPGQDWDRERTGSFSPPLRQLGGVAVDVAGAARQWNSLRAHQAVSASPCERASRPSK